MARRKRRVRRNAGVGSALLPLALVGGGAWLAYRHYAMSQTGVWGIREGRKVQLISDPQTNVLVEIKDMKTGKCFANKEAFDTWAKNKNAADALLEKLSATPTKVSLLGIETFAMPQDPTVVELDQDPMVYDAQAGRVKTSRRPKADSFTAPRREIIPGVAMPKANTTIPNLDKLSLIMQTVIMREVQADPTMIPYVKELLSQKNPQKAVYQSVRKAAENQLDPKRNPEMAGRWLLSRAKFAKRLQRRAETEAPYVSGLGEEQKFYMATPEGYKEVVQKTSTELAKMTKTTTSSSTASTSGIASLISSLTGSLVDVAKPALETMLQKNLKSVAKQAQAAISPTVTKADTDAKAAELANQEMERLAKQEAATMKQQEASSQSIPTALIVVPIAAAAIPVIFGKK